MEVNNSSGIYNPAAIVESSNKPSARREGAVSRAENEDKANGREKSYQSQSKGQISQVSRQRAAIGETNFSAETLEAIKNGALPPAVIQPKESAPIEGISQVAKQLSSADDIAGDVGSKLPIPEIAASPVPAGSMVNIVV